MEKEPQDPRPSLEDLTRRAGRSAIVHIYSVAVKESYKIDALHSAPTAESDTSIFLRGIFADGGYTVAGEVISVEVCRDYRPLGDFQYGDRGPTIGEIQRFSDELVSRWDPDLINGVEARERYYATVMVDASTLDRMRSAAMAPLTSTSRLVLDLKIVDFDRLKDLGEDEFLELTLMAIRRIECPNVDVRPRSHSEVT